MRITFSSTWNPDSQTSLEATISPLLVGRGRQCQICLPSPMVPLEAGAFILKDGIWHYKSIAGEAIVGSAKVTEGKAVKLLENCIIEVSPYLLTVAHSAEEKKPQSAVERLSLELNGILQQFHIDLLDLVQLKARNDGEEVDPTLVLEVEKHIETLARESGILSQNLTQLREYAAGQAVLSQLLESMGGSNAESFWLKRNNWADMQTMVPEYERDAVQKVKAVSKLLEPRLAKSDKFQKYSIVSEAFWDAWSEVARKSFEEPIAYLGLRYFKKQLKDTIFGYGPLEDLLRSDDVSEIMVVDSSRIYVERGGDLYLSGRRFLSDRVTESVIQRIVARVGRRIDKTKPLVDARLPDGSRVNAVIAPIAITGPTLTIRKFPKQNLRMNDLVAYKALTPSVKNFLKACVQHKCNILISGGTGSGKTTLLNCLTEFFGAQERIITIEDTAELQVLKSHVVGMETKQENLEGVGAFSIRDLVKNALRMRPNRIIVGEVRGPEAIDMLQAMNTGHSGSLATIHSNSPVDAISRLEVLVASDSDLPVSSIRQQIVSAVDVIVQLNRIGNRRVISSVSEVVSYDPDDSTIQLREIFTYNTQANKTKVSASDTVEKLENHNANSGCLCATGRLPTFVGEMLESKIIDINAFFDLN